ncbi:MAG: SMI1/KNR4 family protein [Treponema sp.]|jgi:hypothetical protein|nr:SMI1/KNR4 family protein [Treponema sp.]
MTISEIYTRIKTLSEISPYYCSTTGTYIENPWKLFPPAEKDGIIAFEQKGYSLPEELRALLLLSNGIEYSCGEQRIYSIEDIITMSDVFKHTYKPGIFNMGYFWQDWILIDSAHVEGGDYLLYVPDVGKIGYTFGYGFSLFLERLMYGEFNNFWQWVQNPQKARSFLRP